MTKQQKQAQAKQWAEQLQPPESKGQREQRELLALARLDENLYFEYLERTNQ